MATRFYFTRAVLSAEVTPSSWSAGWNKTTGVGTDRQLVLRKIVSEKAGDSTAGVTNTASGTSGHFTAIYRNVSAPLLAQTISGTIKGQFACFETAAGDNYTLAVAIKVIQADGSDRGVLLAVSASDDTSATPPEFDTTYNNRAVRDSSESASLTLSSLGVSTGDRLVIEVGYRQASTSTNAGGVNRGAFTSQVDQPEDDTTNTDVRNPWIEFSGDISLAPTYAGSAATPEDAASEINEPVTSAVTPPTGMLAGDLVLLWGQLQVASANASITQSELGGQTWEQVSLTAQGNDQSVNLYFCTFDGTWDANPSIAFAAQSGTQPATCGMHVFRPPSTSYTWALDSAAAFSAFAAPSTPFTVTRSGQTLNNDNTVTLAGWFTGDDNSWTSIAGTGWSVTGTDQYRNTAGGDQSASFAHYINATAGSPSPSTGDVSKNQTTVTGDAGITVIATFYASAPSPDATANPSGVVGTGAAGTPTVSGDANVSITGASATGSAGDLTVTIGVDVSAALSGVQATGAAGDMAVTGTADVSITGVSATGSAGTLTVSGDAAASITGVSATGSAGDLTVGIGFDVAITGVSATGSAGEFSISGDSVLTLSGVSATGFAGELTTSESKEVLLTGVSGTGQAGDVTVSTTADVSTELAGVSATGQAGDLIVTGSASVDITGVSATGSAGEQSITGDANVDVSGVQATGSAGELTVSTAVNVEVTPSGVSAIGSAGDLIATGTADVSITGVAATGFAGELTITADASATIDGVSATGQAGNLSIEAGAVVLPSGVVGTGFAGTISVTGDANVDITGVSATGSSGTLTVSTDGETTNVDLTGVSATGSAGTLSITGDANVSITGVGATAEAGTLTISAGALAEISGVSATGSAGDLTVTGTAVVDLFGVTATGQAGDLVASSNDVSVTLLGVSATGMVGLLEASVDQIPELSSVGGRGVIKGRKKKGFTVFEQQVTRKDAVVILRGASSKGIAGSIFVETMKPERARRRRIATALVLS